MGKTIEHLKRVIEKSDLSQGRLAAKSGVTESNISRLRSGERVVSIDTAERLLDALDHELVIRPKARTAKAKKGK